jgi:hypothetical protein
MTDDEQPPLFEHPAPPPPKFRSPRQVAAQTAIRYSKIKPPGRRILCDDCCREIHRLGQAVAPYPSHATWRRTGPDGAQVLCQRHKTARHDDEPH